MKKSSLASVIGFVVGLVGSIWFTHRCTQPEIITINDTIQFVDTIQFLDPVPVDSIVYRYVTIEVPLATEEHDSVASEDNDSVKVVLPEVHKEYQDSTYHAWVSGYVDVNLDSINVYSPTKYIYVTKKQKPKRWGLGIQTGVCVTPKGFGPFVGVGVSYNIFSW